MVDLYDYIKLQETYYQTMPVPVVEGYEWNMFEHVKRTTLYLNSQYQKGKPGEKPFRNIILPKLNLEHRAVEFSLKEIEFFINESEQNYKSFLVRKYHDKWARNNGISQFLDDLTETYTDYGGVLVKRVKNTVEVVPFQRLAFVDQTDMLSGSICEKHQYSIDQLKAMESVGWGNAQNGATHTIEEVIALSDENKEVSQADGKQTQALSKNIEVYELHGTLPEWYLDRTAAPTQYKKQVQVVCYYKDSKGDRKGVSLFAKAEPQERYKAFKRDPIYGRALGRGGVEELFEPQVWVNYSEIQKKELLDQASKIIYQTADENYTSKNDTENSKNGQVFVHAPGGAATQLNTTPINVTAFEGAVAQWNETAKDIAAAYDSITGAGEQAKVPFRSSALFNQEAHSLHKYRKGKLGGIFIPEIYRDWIIPQIARDIVKGDKFLADLTLTEMEEVSDQVITAVFNRSVIKKLLGGEGELPQIIQPGEQESLLETYKTEFFKGGNKKFVEILQGEMANLPLDVVTNITDESKDYALRADKLSAVFTQATNILMSAPNFFADHPEMAKLFNDIIEFSGLSPIVYGARKQQVQQATQVPQPVQVPQQIPEPQTINQATNQVTQ